MSEINRQINSNMMRFLSTTASNYELSNEFVYGNSKSIFAHYDTNGDNILQADELSVFKKDIEYANNDKDKNSLSKAECKSFLKNIGSNIKLKQEDLNNFIDNIMANYMDKISSTSNGVIESFEQGDSGDCWLLSQLNALNTTTWGQEAIKNSIVQDETNGNYTVKLKGVDYEAVITQDEIQRARMSDNYSAGDLDVLLLEIATERYLTQEVEAGNIVRGEDVLDGNFGAGKLTMNYLLTGKTGHNIYMMNMSREEHKAFVEEQCKSTRYVELLKQSQDYISNVYDTDAMRDIIMKISNENDAAITCSLRPAEDWSNGESYSSAYKENFFDNIEGHEYSIKEIKTDTSGNITDIILSNPWDSERVIHKSLDEFLDQVAGIAIVNESDNYEHIIEGLAGSVVRIE